jgi:rod shape-determining protein MreD
MSDHDFLGFHLLKLIGIYFFLFILLIMNVIDIPFLGTESGRLSLLLVGIYFWTVYRPSLLPFPLIFALGLMLDFLSGGLIGLYAFCFMVMVIIVKGQRRFLLGQSWPVVWAGFCVAVFVVTAFQFLAYSLSLWSFPPLLGVAFNLIISFLLYPLLLPVMMLLNRQLSD